MIPVLREWKSVTTSPLKPSCCISSPILKRLLTQPPPEGRINAFAPHDQIRVHLPRLRLVRSQLIPRVRPARRSPTTVDERAPRSRRKEGKDSKSSSLLRIGAHTARSYS